MVTKDGQCQLQGEEQFAESAARFAYPEDVVKEARRAVKEIIDLAGQGQFPFQQHR